MAMRVHHPDFDDVGDDQRCEQGGDDRADGGHHHEYRAAAEAVGNDAGEGGETDGRDASHEAYGADLESRVRQVEHEVALGGELHPLAEHRADVADPEDAEVGNAQRRERAGAIPPAATIVGRGGGRLGGHASAFVVWSGVGRVYLRTA